ncbi:MAG: DnaJ domain-containing protein [Sandaracinaceae bacterium]|nr:DnaJ domain-containing protein [Sandaracinaceae bacterium]
MALSKPVHELSDAELEAELERRRRARAGQAGSVASVQASGAEVSPRVQRALDAIEKDREVLQAYANLELSKGASWSEIETRYRELLARFHPDKHRADPERYRAALDVVAGLTRAYQVLYERVKR